MMVVKVGGSLLSDAGQVMSVLRQYNVLIVPGGGVFADIVRRVYSSHDLSEEAAHKMAVLAMHQYGFYLSDISGVALTKKIEIKRGPRIILPLEIVEQSNLPSSWDIASDTIACYIAKSAGKSSFIKLTDVQGIIKGGEVITDVPAGKLLNTTTCLDKSLPAYLQTWKMDCRVLSGREENIIRRALEGDPVGTLITGGK